MFVEPRNPAVLSLLESHRKRSFNLEKVQPIVVDGVKLCAWCNAVKAKGPKYCGPNCRLSARAFAYPQKEEGLNFLLIRQSFECASCRHDYKPLIKQLLVNGRIYKKPSDYLTELCFSLMRRLKQKSPKEFKPEVDHIVPISKGGSSIGLSNHQALCFTCHKMKSKVDNSGPRKKAI